MSTISRWIAAWTIAFAAPALVVSPAWAGQEDQFTPEFKAVRSAADPKHTPKIVAPDTPTTSWRPTTGRRGWRRRAGRSPT